MLHEKNLVQKNSLKRLIALAARDKQFGVGKFAREDAYK